MIKRKDLEPLNKEAIIDLFVEFADKVEKQIQQLQDDVASLREENRRLKLPKNSQNSSRPPSQDIAKLPRQKSLRKSSGKKTGGQKGHKGNTLKQIVNPDLIITHKPSQKCPQCGRHHTDSELEMHSKRQIVDIPPTTAQVTEHQVFQYKCSCGHLSQGQYPKEVTAPVKYGHTGLVHKNYSGSKNLNTNCLSAAISSLNALILLFLQLFSEYPFRIKRAVYGVQR